MVSLLSTSSVPPPRHLSSSCTHKWSEYKWHSVNNVSMLVKLLNASSSALAKVVLLWPCPKFFCSSMLHFIFPNKRVCFLLMASARDVRNAGLQKIFCTHCCLWTLQEGKSKTRFYAKIDRNQGAHERFTILAHDTKHVCKAEVFYAQGILHSAVQVLCIFYDTELQVFLFNSPKILVYSVYMGKYCNFISRVHGPLWHSKFLC